MNSMSGKKLKGIPYTGTLPATLTGTKAGYLHSYKIYGNTEQTGTPTPENPIEPQECGERTENEAWTGWAQDCVTRINNSQRAAIETIDGRTCLWFVTSAGTDDYDNKYILKTDWKENTRYTFSFKALRLSTESKASTIQVWYTDGSSEYFPRTINSGTFESYTFTTAVNKTVKYITSLFTSGGFRIDIDTFMVNKGSTALPYIPYGYKLPLTSAGQDVDIYLGENQTTRRIKKLVLTGEESWSKSSQAFYSDVIDSYAKRNSECVCSHFPYSTTNGVCITLPSKMLKVFEAALPSGVTTSNELKTYLTAQYANGTPVTVWYVLATEETGTLNEPLRKIGNYADTIDSTQTSVQIPTTASSTTISWAGEGLAPSQFDSIQEWVDTPTYMRVNGEWVADNSN